MIPIELKTEPADLDSKIRQPGLSAIDELVGRSPRRKRPGPKRDKVASREDEIPAKSFPTLWREALPDMLVAYERRCAYLAMYIEHATGNPTVDHVVPKSRAWKQVYEWSNYRLCAASINTKKGSLLTIVDPFEAGIGWFALNLSTFHVTRGDVAPPDQLERIDATLPVLNQKLCVAGREEYVRCYRIGPDEAGVSLSYLEVRAPFIAAELRRQGQLLRGDQ